jgi:hypothetical protein
MTVVVLVVVVVVAVGGIVRARLDLLPSPSSKETSAKNSFCSFPLLDYYCY